MKSRSTLTFPFLGTQCPPPPHTHTAPALRTFLQKPTQPPHRCFLFQSGAGCISPWDVVPAGRDRGHCTPGPAVPGEIRSFAPSCPLAPAGGRDSAAGSSDLVRSLTVVTTGRHSARPQEAVFPGTSRLNQPQGSESRCFWGV